MDTPRYFVAMETSHCCFECQVQDRAKPEMIGGKHWKNHTGNYQYEAVCECWSVEHAERIAALLNKAEQP